MSPFQLRVKLLRASHQLLGESFSNSAAFYMCANRLAHIFMQEINNTLTRRIVRCRANESGVVTTTSI